MVRATKQPVSAIIFPPQEERPNRSQDVVKGHRENRCKFAAAKDPCEQEREQAFEPEQRRKRPENPDRRPTRHSAGRGPDFLESRRPAPEPFPQDEREFHG